MEKLNNCQSKIKELEIKFITLENKFNELKSFHKNTSKIVLKNLALQSDFIKFLFIDFINRTEDIKQLEEVEKLLKKLDEFNDLFK